ncbi:uncharacterized protein TRIADDRAFT_17025, partial [Trichoplax adhaerens]
DLISNKLISKALWGIAGIALLGNLVIIAIKVLKYRNQPESVLGLLSQNLSVANLLLSSYVFIIGSADIAYHDHYAKYSELWLKGPFCSLSCILASMSSLISSAVIIFMTVDRFISIVIPHKTNLIQPKKAKYIIDRTWIVVFIFVTIPNLFSINAEGDARIYGYVGICLPVNYD